MDDYAANMSTAGRLTPPGRVRAAIDSHYDEDWFAVDLVAGRRYVVEQLGSRLGYGTLTDPFFRGVHGPDGALLPGTPDDDGAGGYDALSIFTPSVTGRHYLAAGAFLSLKGTYLLQIAEDVDDYGVTPETAGLVAPGAPKRGAIERWNDVDGFRLTVEPNLRYRIDVLGADTGDGTLPDPYLVGLFGSTGAWVRNFADEAGEGRNSRAEFRLGGNFGGVPSVDFYIWTTGGADTIGTYRIEVSIVRDPRFGADDPDTLGGTPDNDDLSGLGGGDRLTGLAGHDTLRGDDGDDTLEGGAGWDLLLGGEGDDRMSGGDDRDRLDGGAGADALSGDGGDDLLIGGPGSNLMDGGAGVDTAVFDRLRSTTTLVGDSADRIATHEDTGETDALADIEYLEFLDGALVSAPDSPEALIRRLYDVAFDRTPELRGGDAWRAFVAAGAPLAEIGEALAASEEFAVRYGALDDAAFVRRLYLHGAGREPDAQGAADWAARLAGGDSRGAVMAAFAQSEEVRAGAADAVSAGLWRQDLLAATLVRLYLTALDRPPGAAETGDWLARLAAASEPYPGWREGFLADSLVFSEEFLIRFGDLPDDAFVDRLYANGLDRPTDAAAAARWTAALAAGSVDRGYVAQAIAGSPELAALTDALFVDGFEFA